MKNLVVTVILIGVLGYFGAKFYLHHEVSTNLDSTLDMIRPFADIRYDGVSSTMTGELSVDGITARFGNYKDRMEIDKVSIITPGFWYLLNLGDLGSSGAPELPKSFGFAIDGLKADVSDDFMKALAKAAREAAPEADANDVGANCVGKYGFSMDTLRQLGYDDVVLSMAMGYRQEGERLLVDISADIEDMYGMQIDLTLDGTITLQAVARGTFRPRMIDGRLEYEDYSLIDRTKAYCRSEGLSDDEILAAELDAFKAAGMENGIAFDEYVMIPYQKFLNGGSRFVLTARPNEPISLTQIDLYKPEDVPALLNLSAEVH